MSLPGYNYSPLASGREISLVELWPGEGESPLHCTIRHVHLDGKPTYECLSYCWALNRVAGQMHCGNSTLDLFENLDLALHQIRQKRRTRILWVDRISINQTDKEEKSSQVALMGEIFSTASRVICWVGREDEETQGLFKFVVQAEDTTFAVTRNFEKENDPRYAYSVALDSILDHYPWPSSQWTALENFLRRDWFLRIWILQEVVVAAQAIIYCGSHCLPFDLLEIVVVITNAKPIRFSERPLWNCQFANEMCPTRMAYHAKHLIDHRMNLTIIGLLSQNRLKLTTERHDKVYALLNIAYDLNNTEKDGLRPDYTRGWQSVYTEMAKWLMNHYRDLKFLKLVEIGESEQDGLPSWVPNFNTIRNRLNFLYQVQVITPISGTEFYNCTGAAKTRYLPTNSSASLCVEGIGVDVITKVSDPPGNLTGNIALNSNVLDGGAWEKFVQDAAPTDIYIPTSKNITLAYARLRCGDLHTDDRVLRRRESWRLPKSIPSSDQITYSSTDGYVHGDKRSLAYLILCQTSRRRLVLTSKGYLGLATRDAKVGDKIYLLLGGDMPFVLRPSGGANRFMGEAYIHGLMDGEGLIHARSKADPLYNVTDTAWLQELDSWEGPWPFETEKVVIE